MSLKMKRFSPFASIVCVFLRALSNWVPGISNKKTFDLDRWAISTWKYVNSGQILTNACDSVNASGCFFSLSKKWNKEEKTIEIKAWWNFHHKLPVAYAKSISKRETWKLFRIGKDFDENSICLKKEKLSSENHSLAIVMFSFFHFFSSFPSRLFPTSSWPDYDPSLSSKIYYFFSFFFCFFFTHPIFGSSCVLFPSISKSYHFLFI